MYRSATSTRTMKPKVTVGVAPTFRSTARLERRKEVLFGVTISKSFKKAWHCAVSLLGDVVSANYQHILVSVLPEIGGETESS